VGLVDPEMNNSGIDYSLPSDSDAFMGALELSTLVSGLFSI
jgi:hypothetical protein